MKKIADREGTAFDTFLSNMEGISKKLFFVLMGTGKWVLGVRVSILIYIVRLYISKCVL